MIKSIVLFVMLLSACAPIESSLIKTNGAIDEYVHRFERDTGKSAAGIPFFFTKEKTYLGACVTFSDGKRYIELEVTNWEKSDDIEREELVYHELGHCALNRDHDNQLVYNPLVSYRIPNSVMYPYNFGKYSVYKIFREHYVAELTNPGKQM